MFPRMNHEGILARSCVKIRYANRRSIGLIESSE
jgi:hypothetical protein